jgi:hypothetical protein
MPQQNSGVLRVVNVKIMVCWDVMLHSLVSINISEETTASIFRNNLVTTRSSGSLIPTALHILDDSILKAAELDINMYVKNWNLKFANRVKGNEHSGFTK